MSAVLAIKSAEECTKPDHEGVAEQIRGRLRERGESIADAIAQRNLYFRVSLIGSCNLSCPFCHNEGASTKGKLDVAFATQAIMAAYQLGFRRVQFTGGEPLLHPKVESFVAAARQIVADVGITTNGSYLPKKLNGLVEAGLRRIHISLQAESLSTDPISHWTIPPWLSPVLKLARRGILRVRLNLPVMLSDLDRARAFLVELSGYGCDVNLFSILPQGPSSLDYPSSLLEEVAAQENERRSANHSDGIVFVRGYREPSGIRCATCKDKARCKEQSHSLRMGADRVLRPCLATREWDLSTGEADLAKRIEAGTLLSLDYLWPDPVRPNGIRS